MNFLRCTIILILLFTTSCKTDQTIQEDLVVLPPRIDKQEVKRRFLDLPFDSEQEIKIALLLPLSGKHQKLGKDLYNAAQLAMFDHGDPRIVIYPFDTKGSDFTAISVMEEVLDKNIKYVIGPVFSKNLEAIKPIVKQHGLTVFSFSNNQDIVEPNIYTLGLNVRQQIERLVSYSQQNGYEYFTALAPGNAYGSQLVDTLRNSTPADAVLKTEFYAPNQDIKVNLRRLLRTLNESPVDEEGQPLFVAAEDLPEAKTLEVTGEAVLEGVNIAAEQDPLVASEEFDFASETQARDISEFKRALLIADSSVRLKSIAEYLKENNLSENIKILGMSEWDNNKYLTSKVFDNGWYADLPKENYLLFEDHFLEEFGYLPNKIAGYAYDIISVISSLAAYYDQGDVFDLQRLNNPVGFSGISGVFRFKQDGSTERLLDIYEIINGISSTVDPAPFQFGLRQENTLIINN